MAQPSRLRLQTFRVLDSFYTGIGMPFTGKVVAAPSRQCVLGGLTPANRHGTLHHVFFSVLYSGSGRGGHWWRRTPDAGTAATGY